MSAVAGTFSDFRTAKGRKVGILSIEVPIEQVDATLKALGGFPQPHDPKWVGIALLDMTKVKEPAEKPKRKMGELPIPNQIALHCDREAFQRFLAEAHRASALVIGDAEKTAEAIRWHLGVNSRAEVMEGSEAAEKWFRLKADFDLWMRDE